MSFDYGVAKVQNHREVSFATKIKQSSRQEIKRPALDLPQVSNFVIELASSNYSRDHNSHVSSSSSSTSPIAALSALDIAGSDAF